MSLINDLIKIKYVREGYLPNWPYHLISYQEMCDAFLSDTGYFATNYPCVDPTLQDIYDNLFNYISQTIDNALNTASDSFELPNWIYSYMLGNVISINSSKQDIHDLLILLNADNIDDDWTPLASRLCYQVSTEWLGKAVNSIDNRPPTIFGEMHVIKSLRVDAAKEVSYTTYSGEVV